MFFEFKMNKLSQILKINYNEDQNRNIATNKWVLTYSFDEQGQYYCKK